MLAWAEQIRDQVGEFMQVKRRWLKAYEVLEDIMLATQEFASAQERNIFKYQFVMNFVARSREQRPLYALEQLNFVSNNQEFVETKVLPVLQRR